MTAWANQHSATQNAENYYFGRSEFSIDLVVGRYQSKQMPKRKKYIDGDQWQH